MKSAIENIASLYGYCLRKVEAIWRQLADRGEAFTPQEVQAGAATVFLQAVRYMPIEFLQGDNNAVTEEHRAMVDRLVEIYSQALHTSLDRWKKLGPYNMDAVQAGAASIMIQLLKVNYPFDEVRVSQAKSESTV
jgi:hypothetical protein